MIYVIGSGPAGVSCAHALVQQGLNVTMLDAGLELEPERAEVVGRLYNSHPAEWDHDSLSVITENMSPNAKGIPLKHVYGSNFPYRETNDHIPLVANQVETSPSLAQGGLSNVWGAAVLPYISRDIAEWPISITDLKPHYEAVFSFMDLAATPDRLASIFPIYSNSHRSLHASSQAQALLKDLYSNAVRLNSEGFSFGLARLAVRAHTSQNRPGCVYCGLCMYGCPYSLIYNSSSTLSHLKKLQNFRYVKDTVVEKVIESNGQVEICAKSMVTKEKVRFKASRVYLACGVLSTTKILLESLEAYGKPLIMKDSQYFLLPLLRYKKGSDVVNEELHTLSQAFVEIFDRALSECTIHLQIYTYNDLYLNAIRHMLGKPSELFRWPINELLGRLLVIQGYLHSNDSARISVSLQTEADSARSKMTLEAHPNELTEKIIKSIAVKLFRNRKYFKAIPISPLLHIAKPGRGFHSGGTFPMRREPSHFESDCLGRPYGFQRVHAVDATVFPSIPATTITLSVMANAHRIASAYNET